MNFELRNELANFGTKFGIFWQKLCEIDCKTSYIIEALHKLENDFRFVQYFSYILYMYSALRRNFYTGQLLTTIAIRNVQEA